MKLWIVGGNGMLGLSLQELCSLRELKYVATSHRQVDIENQEAVLRYIQQEKPTHVVNCAAYTDVDGAEKDHAKALSVNAMGAYHLAVAAQSVGARCIQISTDYVFDGKKRAPYIESDPCSPINHYGMSKWEGEKRVMAVDPQACIIRTSWLFGGCGKNLISSLVRWMNEKSHIQVVSNQCGSPTFCGDLGEAILELLNFQGMIHFSNQGSVSRYEMALCIWELLKKKKASMICEFIEPVQSDQFITLAKRPAYSVLDTSRYVKIMGKEPRLWQEAMENYLDVCTIA